ncbi:MAG: hypothetical protein KDC85_20795 [Saprospiraceae bacterium]|nr:hypothetical protein [Saprospiraceae bacterium]MCB0847686.1 hypothetical protein [Bacteroidota bacterium]
MKNFVKLSLLFLGVTAFSSWKLVTCYDVFNDAVYAANHVYVHDTEYCGGWGIVNQGYCMQEADLVFGQAIDQAAEAYYACLEN